MIREAQTVCDIFTPIAKSYRAVNSALTFGLDGFWRRRAACAALQCAPAAILDVCTGTGEMAVCLRRTGRGTASVVAVDFCDSMLRQAARRSNVNGITFQQADATSLPFADESFDVVTISFALRNLSFTRERLTTSLRECLRVLRPDGRLVTVETTQPPTALVRRIMYGYVRTVVPRLGAFLSGSRTSYAYFSGTIPRFPGAPEFAATLRETGFGEVDYTYLTFGLVAIHEAVKHSSDTVPSSR